MQVLQIEMQDDKRDVAIRGRKPLNPLGASSVRNESLSAEIDFIQSSTQSVFLCVCVLTSKPAFKIQIPTICWERVVCLQWTFTVKCENDLTLL